MKHIYVVAQQKGGVGKSTTAQAVGTCFSLKGCKTLLLDIDPQCNLTTATDAYRDGGTSHDLLTGRASAKDIIQPVKEKLDIIPASSRLSSIAQELTKTGREYKLKEALTPILDDYDYIVIDTPPALGELTINALTASTDVIIPTIADTFSLDAIRELGDTLETVRKYTNKDLQVAGVLLTRYQPRSIHTQELTALIQETAEGLGTSVFKTRIREGVAIREAQTMRTDIFSYAPKSKVASDYRAFFTELTGREKKRHGK